VFISHANHSEDLPLVERITNWLKLIKVTPILAKDAYEPNYVTEKIGGMIDQSESVLVIYTSNAQQSGFVQQEIGYAHRAGKRLIILKSPEAKLTGFSYGYDTIDLGAEDLSSEFDKLERTLTIPERKGSIWDIIVGAAAIAAVCGLIFLAVKAK
jgi:hypothetical protein